MKKYVETVCGPMLIEDIGRTLTHEHLIIDIGNFYGFFNDKRHAIDEKVTLENRDRIVKSLKSIWMTTDNNIFDNADDMAEELKHYAAAGGKTIFEVTPIDIGRDPLKLREISEKSGVNVIMGVGYYGVLSMTTETRELLLQKGSSALADFMIREFYDGVGDTGIKPGVIGEIGMHRGETERILALAAIIAQKETGAPLIFHNPPVWVLDLAEREGADLSKIVMGHWTMREPVEKAIKKGAWVSMDQFGINYPGIMGDDERIEDVLKIFENGWEKQLLLSQDVCYKVRLKKYGGAGFGELFSSTFSKMVERGITQEQLDMVVVDNVKRLLS